MKKKTLKKKNLKSRKAWLKFELQMQVFTVKTCIIESGWLANSGQVVGYVFLWCLAWILNFHIMNGPYSTRMSIFLTWPQHHATQNQLEQFFFFFSNVLVKSITGSTWSMYQKYIFWAGSYKGKFTLNSQYISRSGSLYLYFQGYEILTPSFSIYWGLTAVQRCGSRYSTDLKCRK